jgi:hypothetical protein
VHEQLQYLQNVTVDSGCGFKHALNLAACTYNGFTPGSQCMMSVFCEARHPHGIVPLHIAAAQRWLFDGVRSAASFPRQLLTHVYNTAVRTLAACMQGHDQMCTRTMKS